MKKFLFWSLVIAFTSLMACSKDDPELPLDPDQPEQPSNPENPEGPDGPGTPEEPGEEEPGADGYRVYAYNNTGWPTLSLYMWGDKNALNGEWPGMKPTGTTTINGYDFFYYDMGAQNTGLTENLIFSNNGANQLEDFKYVISEDIYLEVTVNYVAKINPDNFTPSSTVTTDGTAVTDMVVYEANPRFFGSSDCLNALTRELPRIADLGCNVLWIMPICEPSTEKSIGSPYSIKNYYVINSKYGTISDLQQLVTTAHSLGIKVVLDWVPNHTGWDNPWIKEHPDWFLHENGNIVSPPGTNWSDVAQLNYNNPEVGMAMSQAIEYWVDLADLDGIRFDYADSPYITPDFWKTIATELRTIKSDFILLAESSNYVFYNYGFDMIYDWNSAQTISEGFVGAKASNIVTQAQNSISKVPAGDSILRYVFNHDVMAENAIDKYFGSLNALPAAYVCASMLNGTPMIYSGMDATGLTGTQNIMGYQQLTFSPTLTPVYNAINEAFKTTTSVRKGALSNYSNSDVVCFTRTTSENILLVVVNTKSDPKSVKTPTSIANSSMYDLISGQQVNLGDNIELSGYEYLILQK